MKYTGELLFEEFLERFGQISDEELVQLFNKEVGNQGWGTARASFLTAIHHEFDKRGFDYSEIGDSDTLSFKNLISLTNKKVSTKK
jgi:hypothetical protein